MDEISRVVLVSDVGSLSEAPQTDNDILLHGHRTPRNLTTLLRKRPQIITNNLTNLNEALLFAHRQAGINILVTPIGPNTEDVLKQMNRLSEPQSEEFDSPILCRQFVLIGEPNRKDRIAIRQIAAKNRCQLAILPSTTPVKEIADAITNISEEPYTVKLSPIEKLIRHLSS